VGGSSLDILRNVHASVFFRDNKNLLLPTFIALVCFLIYFPVLGYEFVRWDDYELILGNPLVQFFSPKIFWSFDPELYVPLTLLTYQIEYALVGAEPFLFHATNLILHAANAVLIFFLLRKVLQDPLLAAGGALLFAVHPLHAETVSWISARKELLMTLLSIGSLLAALNADEKERAFSPLGLILFLCALLSKVTAISVPLVLALLLWHRRRAPRKIIKTIAPYLGLSVLFGIIALVGRSDPLMLLTPLQTLLLAFRSAAFSLQQFFLPLRFSAIYPAPTDLSVMNPIILLSAAVVMGLMVAAFLFRRRMPLVSIGFAIFIISLAPSFLAYAKSNDVTMSADRYAYLPLIGLVLLVTSLLYELLRKRSTLALVILIALSAPLSFKAFAQSHTWQTTETLFLNVLQSYPNSHVALNNLGQSALVQNQTDSAMEYFRKALTQKPNYPDALVNLGAAYGRKNMLLEAEQMLQKALNLDPDHPNGVYNLAGVYMVRGQTAEAIRLYKRAIDLAPFFTPAHWHLARTLHKAGNHQEARIVYQRLLEMDSSYRGRSAELDGLLQ